MNESNRPKDKTHTTTPPVTEDAIDTKLSSYDALQSEYQKLLAHCRELQLERDMLYRVVEVTHKAMHQ